jgi:peroxiredoxin
MADLQERSVPIGQHTPAFVLPRNDRGMFGSADLIGTPFVLHFYSGSDDSWIEQSACLDAIAPALGMCGVAIVGIVCGEPERVRIHFEAGHGAHLVLLDWEPKALVSRLYGFNHNDASPELSATYLVDHRGIIIWAAFDEAKGLADSLIIANAVRLHLSRPSTVDPSD